MKFYVDFDDCLCETARAFTMLASKFFGKDVPYENIRTFNLQKAFDLNDDEYEHLMIEGHQPEILLSYEETPGASQVLNELIDQGHEVFIITGRPLSTREASFKWLDEHGLSRVKMFFLDKYGRDYFIKNSAFNLGLDDYYQMHFDVAIEDSPRAFKFFDHLPDLKVMVFDRPWNQESELPGSNYTRCADWKRIREQVSCLLR